MIFSTSTFAALTAAARTTSNRPTSLLQPAQTMMSSGHVPVALKLALSATVTDDRIRAVLGDDAAIWSLAAENPHNDIMRRPEDLVEFKRHLRRLLDRIKAVHGEMATINVFPAVPNSAAVEVGRVLMPKADLPLRIYDQNRFVGGFIPTLTIAG